MKLLIPFLLLFELAVYSHAAATRPPNIVYILADDLGWTDLHCQGSEYYETPNIDRLASQGLRMQRFYNSQNCTPTRAALMSGQYAPRTGVYTVQSLDRGPLLERRMNVLKNSTKLELDKFILPRALKTAGVLRIGEGRTLQPPRRHRGETQPRRATSGKGKGAGGSVGRLADECAR